MALLSDRESFDKVMTIRARFRLLADPYINKIRNKHKKEYASNYAIYLEVSGDMGDSPEHDNLSYMAAQAVRINLCEFWNKANSNN